MKHKTKAPDSGELSNCSTKEQINLSWSSNKVIVFVSSSVLFSPLLSCSPLLSSPFPFPPLPSTPLLSSQFFSFLSILFSTLLFPISTSFGYKKKSFKSIQTNKQQTRVSMWLTFIFMQIEVIPPTQKVVLSGQAMRYESH